MSPGSSTDSYPAFAHIGLRENPGKNLNQTDMILPPFEIGIRISSFVVPSEIHLPFSEKHNVYIIVGENGSSTNYSWCMLEYSRCRLAACFNSNWTSWSSSVVLLKVARTVSGQRIHLLSRKETPSVTEETVDRLHGSFMRSPQKLVRRASQHLLHMATPFTGSVQY
ncbi:hypothetical protein ANN_11882 [Periplaneta americana]|uniref:Uncharacterized protein n=1 Tax=Periplaneta americana TaxID=6978 RepID=A0ABQ8T6A7_PERAM|nr:hypothetical protein ANN_11882 [Periplaneta americana]